MDRKIDRDKIIEALNGKKNEIVGLTVYEAMQKLNEMRNNREYTGDVTVKKGKMYVQAQNYWKEVVKNVTFHKGYGFGQINIVLYI